jgi:hypothetical protein
MTYRDPTIHSICGNSQNAPNNRVEPIWPTGVKTGVEITGG